MEKSLKNCIEFNVRYIVSYICDHGQSNEIEADDPASTQCHRVIVRLSKDARKLIHKSAENCFRHGEL